MGHESRSIGVRFDGQGGSQGGAKCPIVRAAGRFETKPDGQQERDLRGVVETALGRALLLAAQAEQWALVQQIAAELTARRVARAGSTVIDPDSEDDGATRRRNQGG